MILLLRSSFPCRTPRIQKIPWNLSREFPFITCLHRFKMEAASEVGVNLKNGYNGDLTSREAGSVGGQMVKKMIESYERNMK